MELVTEPDIYSPSIYELGNYVDKIPAFNTIKRFNMSVWNNKI